jgi:hypothetical protein
MELPEIAKRIEKIGREIDNHLSDELGDRQLMLEKVNADLYELWKDVVKTT